MSLRRLALSGLLLASFSSPGLASDDFNLTYHVERSASTALSQDDCAATVEREAGRTGFRSAANSFPGQLTVISGGKENVGSFAVYCIAVDDKTVSVIHATDYRRQQKGAVGRFADQVHAALRKAAR